MVHPEDDTGDALRRLEADGDDLSLGRDIDFSIVFADESSAQKFAEHFRDAGFKATVRFAEVEEDHPWDVTVAKYLVPSHKAITDFERELDEVAVPLGGHNDGWGCFAQVAEHLE